jgi:uncharacterized protein VirK/YbjX
LTGIHNLVDTRIYTIFFKSFVSTIFNVEQKLEIINHHYIVIKTLIDEPILTELFKEGIKCWNLLRQGNNFCVELCPATNDLREGCMRLGFRFNKIDIFNITFTVVPGRLVGVCESSVICISRVQYTRNQSPNITKATKLLGYITPMAISLHALEGMAKGFNIRAIVGISTRQHINFVSSKNNKSFDKNYDSLWKRMQGNEMKNGNFYLSCPFQKKSLEFIKYKYRMKTLIKRNNLDEISEASYQKINSILAKENIDCKIDTHNLRGSKSYA